MLRSEHINAIVVEINRARNAFISMEIKLLSCLPLAVL